MVDKYYKLTTAGGKTPANAKMHRQITWKSGKSHRVSGGNPGICGSGWLHAYASIRDCVLHNEGGYDLATCRVLEIAGDAKSQVGAKNLFRRQTAVRWVPGDEFVAALAADPDWYVRWQIAGRADLAPEIVAALAKDPDWDVRRQIAGRADLAPEIVAALAKDPDGDVRRQIAGRADGRAQ